MSNNEKLRASIHVNGIVQGVGFRPFVYRVAKLQNLTGYVLNLGDAGVRIIVEGTKFAIEGLILSIKTEPPSISRIDELSIEWSSYQQEFQDFHIEKSSTKRNDDAEPIIPPDIATCDDCIQDLFNPKSRWYHYPFSSCAACGPRYSTITDLPYDRPNTTMVDFPLCDTCNTGYTDPLDRRYHAQTTACQKCGPRYELMNNDGGLIKTDNPVRDAAQLLSHGFIIAIQGISGTHLVTITSNASIINKLKKKKRRFQRPLAIMLRNLETVREAFDINVNELKLLESWKRPIVLLNKADTVIQLIPEESLEAVAPGLDSVGVMLPYAPIHHLLFKYLDESALVMTSANPTGFPMYIEKNSLITELSEIADFFLVHNRRIHQREDDSVIKFVNQVPVFIRRARGYVPDPLSIKGISRKTNIIATGPEEKVTGAVLRSGKIYMTQHIGDTDRIENIEFLQDALSHISSLIGSRNIDAIACDLHPEFLTTELAKKYSLSNNIPLYQVQHHHAHLASILVDHKLNLNTDIICITADGYGYGSNGAAWGGEILKGNALQFQRVGGLASYKFPGGDLSARFAIRPLLGFLSDEYSSKQILNLVNSVQISENTPATQGNVDLIIQTIRKGINTVQSSSTGRVLDAAALVLGVCSHNSYDGECPMKLEAIAKKIDVKIKPQFKRVDHRLLLESHKSILQLMDLKKQGMSVPHLSYAFQEHIGSNLAEIAIQKAQEYNITHVGFSGGVALNRIITQSIVEAVTNAGLVPLMHSHVPPGDAGISVGQIAVAAAGESRL